MKIITGKFKGRRFKNLEIETTRPTMDRVKESLFAMISGNLLDSVVLDLFAGSGALGLEALSNGAKEVYFNDKNIKCINYIKNVAKELSIVDLCKFSSSDYSFLLEKLDKDNIKFDVIFLDPPYAFNKMNELLKMIKTYKVLNDSGIIICEVSNLFEPIDFQLIKDRRYGDKHILILKKLH